MTPNARDLLLLLSAAAAPTRGASAVSTIAPVNVLDSLPVLAAPRLSGLEVGRYAVLQVGFPPNWQPERMNDLPPAALSSPHDRVAFGLAIDFNRRQIAAPPVQRWAVMLCGPKGSTAVAVVAVEGQWSPKNATAWPPCHLAQGLDGSRAHLTVVKLNTELVERCLAESLPPKVWHVVGLRIDEGALVRKVR